MYYCSKKKNKQKEKVVYFFITHLKRYFFMFNHVDSLSLFCFDLTLALSGEDYHVNSNERIKKVNLKIIKTCMRNYKRFYKKLRKNSDEFFLSLKYKETKGSVSSILRSLYRKYTLKQWGCLIQLFLQTLLCKV